jgi:hypothetical protein
MLTSTPPPIIAALRSRPLISMPLISHWDVIVLKRLAFAFGLVMVIHALCAFEPATVGRHLPADIAGFFSFGCVWLAPAMIYFVALYGAPILTALQTGTLRVVRMTILTGVAFVLSFTSMFAFLALWFVASIVFGFPFREA